MLEKSPTLRIQFLTKKISTQKVLLRFFRYTSKYDIPRIFWESVVAYMSNTNFFRKSYFSALELLKYKNKFIFLIFVFPHTFSELSRSARFHYFFPIEKSHPFAKLCRFENYVFFQIPENHHFLFVPLHISS